jgi:hypothetical protein
MTFKISVTTRTSLIDKYTDLFDGGVLEIRSGTQPANPETAATGTLISSLNFQAISAPAGSNGVATISLPISGSALVAGTIGWGRIIKSGVTVADGTFSITGGGGDFIVAGTSLVVSINDTIAVTSMTFTMPQ